MYFNFHLCVLLSSVRKFNYFSPFFDNPKKLHCRTTFFNGFSILGIQSINVAQVEASLLVYFEQLNWDYLTFCKNISYLVYALF